MTADEQLTGELKEATRGLTFMSESDYPVEVVRWENLAGVRLEYVAGLRDQIGGRVNFAPSGEIGVSG